MTTQQPHIILGIDPGTLFMGFGLIEVCKSSVTLLEMGVLKLARHKDHSERLQLIYQKMDSIIHQYHPGAVAIEAPFFGKNVQSMLKLGRAQGVAIAAAMVNGLAAVEYAPRKVKQSITGRGNASKEQVWDMLKHTLSLTDAPSSYDAADAVAVALCHHYQSRVTQMTEVPALAANRPRGTRKASSSWEAFAASNPGRVGRPALRVPVK